MIVSVIALMALYLSPTIGSFIWGLFCWRPQRLKVWALVNLCYLLILGIPSLQAQGSGQRVLLMAIGAHLLVAIPMAMVQVLVIAFLDHRRAENRRRKSETVRRISETSPLSGPAN